MQTVPYVNLAAQWQAERDDLLPIVEAVLASGQYVGGSIIEEFENQAATLCQTKHCVALNSGTDALVCGLLALGVKPGDEVITPPNSFIASTAAIVHLRAKPVFADVLLDQNIDPEKIEQAITSRTKAIMPVHLTGRMARMDQIMEIANRYGIPVIEDAAQSIGSKYQGIPSGRWGKVGCFSAHPLKNLNACGDAGFLVTDDDAIASQIRSMRNHGMVDRNTVERFGYVSRMDTLQAAILRYRLTELEGVIEKRRRNASLYRQTIDQTHAFIPEDQPEEFNTYHTFVIQTDQREGLKAYLSDHGIETAIHYPVPIHLQPASKDLNYGSGSFPSTEHQAAKILTLPIHQYLQAQDVIDIANQLNRFFL
ncbi:MAG: DegT/DnrJ/EryC1/StrS family aminotransferase [Cyanobacteria bacterium P01_A01_bin.123]